MHILLKVYDISSLSFLLVVTWMAHGAGGGMMDKKWEMMHWMTDKGNQEKKISISLKPIPIPIPIPMAMPMPMKGDMKAQKPEKPWKAESKDIFWKMMIMKMMKGDQKGGKMKMCPPSKPACCNKMMMMMMMPMMNKGSNMNGCSAKCQKGMQMMKGCPNMPMMNGWPMMPMTNGWPMMPMMKASPMSMMKASNMMCCDCSQTMMPMKGCDMGMNGGWAPMMNGGWPPMNNGMCCPSGGGWPDEEEEEEGEQEDYPEDEPMMGWDDTNNDAVYLLPESHFVNSLKDILVSSRKGDISDDIYDGRNLRFLEVFRKGVMVRR